MSVHIRLARPEDLAALSLLATRAFAEDAVIAYLADARAYPSPPPASASSVRELDNRQRLLYYFLDGLARGTLVTQGRIVVVTVDERIVASAYWTRPGAKIDSLPVILKSKQYRGVLGDSRSLFRGWGVRGFIVRRMCMCQRAWQSLRHRAQRAVFEYQARVDAIQKVQCRKRGSDKDQCWHLQLICSDPDAQGKGSPALLYQFDGAERAPFRLFGNAHAGTFQFCTGCRVGSRGQLAQVSGHLLTLWI